MATSDQPNRSEGLQPMTQAGLSEVIDALRSGRFQDYEALVKAFPKSEEADELWEALASAHGANPNLFERLLVWPTETIQRALRFLMPAVRHLSKLKTTEGLQFLEFADRVGPSFRHGVSEQLRPHIVARPGLGRELGEAIRDSALKDGARRVWATAFANGAVAEAARYTMELAIGEATEPQLASMLLQALSNTDAVVLSVLGPHEQSLADFLVGALPKIGRDGWFALAAMAEYSPAAMLALVQGAKRGDTEALVAISNWLYRIDTTLVGANAMPLSELVNELLQQGLRNDQARHFIDSGVGSLLYQVATRGAVLPCVARLGGVDADVAELFGDVFNALCEEPADFTKLLTEWLLAEGVTFTAVSSLLSRCSAQQAPVGLDASLFAAAAVARKAVAGRRLLALTHNGPLLCQFIAVLAETPVMQPHGLELAAFMLNEAFVEYPGATVEFLQPRTRAATRHHAWAPLYRGVYANALRWRRVLTQLPQLLELRQTDAEWRALRSMRQRLNRDIMRVAAERSVFATLFTNVNVAQGHRFASHTVHGAPQVVEMKQASHHIELPSSELADPVGGMLRRAMALGAAR